MPTTASSSTSSNSKSNSNTPSELLSLPTEILILILQKLGTNDLYNLAHLNRSLNHLALSTLFTRNHITTGPDACYRFTGLAVDLLPLLRIALFVTSAKEVHCRLKYPDPKFLTQIRDLATLLRRLGHLDKFSLSLHLIECVSPIMVHAYTLEHPGTLARALQVLFTNAAYTARNVTIEHGDVLQELLERSLKAAQGSVAASQGQGGYKTRRFSIAEKAAPTTKNTLIAPATPNLRSTSTTTISSKRRMMRNLSVNSVLLLSAQFIDWTVHTINASALLTLSFDGTRPKHHHYHNHPNHTDAWTVPLARITVPTLETLSIKGCAVAFDDIRLFIARHHALATLHVDLNALKPSIALLSKFKRTLFGAGTMMGIGMTTRGALSLQSLKRVEVGVTIPAGQYFDFGQVQTNLAPFVPHLSSKVSLRLVIGHDISRYDCWIRKMHVKGISTSASANSNSSSIISSGGTGGDNHGNPVSHITGLEFTLWGAFGKENVSVLVLWLRSFPGLKSVAIAKPDSGALEELRVTLLKALAAAFAETVEVVEMNGVPYDLKEWTRLI